MAAGGGQKRNKAARVCRAVRTEAIDKLPGSGDGKTDQAAADAVIEKINGIGTVTKNSKSAIEAARRAYDALSEDQKALIPAGAVKTLTDAEAAYAKMTRHNHSGNASGGTKDDTGKVESQPYRRRGRCHVRSHEPAVRHGRRMGRGPEAQGTLRRKLIAKKGAETRSVSAPF